MTRNIRIKFLARTSASQDPALWLSLFPERNPHIGQYEFIFDPDAQNYDALVVYEDLTFLPGEKRSNRCETLACAQENTLFITTEPSSIKMYGPKYLRQFGHVLSAQPRQIINHPGHIFRTPPLRWYYGRPLSDDDNNYTDVDNFRAATSPLKTHNVSTVCSNKQMSEAFKTRYEFTAELKALLGEDLAWFGRGVRPITDKSEAMDAYKYHITIENHIAPHHWTEKITDSFLAFCLPFYYGPPNASDYFPPDSFIPINIHDVAGTAEIIKTAIDTQQYEARLPAISKARERVLSSYNLMTTITDVMDEVYNSGATGTGAKIYGRHRFRRARPFAALQDIIHRKTVLH